MNLEGGCACKAIRYRITESPLIVHACHCRDCQRLTGGPFVINIWIEAKFVEPGPVAPKSFRLPVCARRDPRYPRSDQAGRSHLHPQQAAVAGSA